MKINTIVCCLVIGCLAGESEGQLIPRWHWTKANLRCGVPKAEYQTMGRSPSVTQVSETAILLEDAKSETDELATAVALSAALDATEEVAPAPATATTPEPLGSLASRIRQSVRGLGASSLWAGLVPEQLIQEAPEVTTLRDYLTRPVETKLFQFSEPEMEIDHCRISKLAVYVQSDGRWVVNLQADQNRTAGFDQTKFLRQNQFVVTVRCLGAHREDPLSAAGLLGRPVVAELGPIEFYVRNSQPYSLFATNAEFMTTASNQVGMLRTTDPMRPQVKSSGETRMLRTRFNQIDRVELEFYYRGK